MWVRTPCTLWIWARPCGTAQPKKWTYTTANQHRLLLQNLPCFSPPINKSSCTVIVLEWALPAKLRYPDWFIKPTYLYRIKCIHCIPLPCNLHPCPITSLYPDQIRLSLEMQYTSCLNVNFTIFHNEQGFRAEHQETLYISEVSKRTKCSRHKVSWFDELHKICETTSWQQKGCCQNRGCWHCQWITMWMTIKFYFGMWKRTPKPSTNMVCQLQLCTWSVNDSQTVPLISGSVARFLCGLANLNGRFASSLVLKPAQPTWNLWSMVDIC